MTDVAVIAKKKLKAKKKKYREKQIRNIILLVIGVAVCFAAIVFVRVSYPFKSTYDDGLGRMVLERELTGNGVFIQNLPEDLPDMAWNSDLPGFVKRDLEWLDEQDHGYIMYMFGEFDIEISKKSTYIEDYYEFCIGNDIYGLTSVSLYETDGKLYIYGVDRYGDDFVEYVVSETEIQENILTFDYEHIPLGLCDEKEDVAWRLADYALLLKDNVFYFYQDGQMISENEFHDEIEDIYWSYSMLRTTNDILYAIHAYQINGIPKITSRYIDDSMVFNYDWGDPDELRLISKDFSYVSTLPIVEKNGEYYTYIPKDWDVYKKYHIDNEANTQLSNLDDITILDRKIVKLEDHFFSAQSRMGEYGNWYADIVFEFGTLSNPTYYEFEGYRITGYDDYYEDCLTEQEIDTLSTTTFSIDGYWEIVEDIRETYEKYYEKKGG